MSENNANSSLSLPMHTAIPMLFTIATMIASTIAVAAEDVPNRIAWRDELRPVLPTGYDFDGCDAAALSPYKSHLMNSYCHAWSCTPTYRLRSDHPR